MNANRCFLSSVEAFYCPAIIRQRGFHTELCSDDGRTTSMLYRHPAFSNAVQIGVFSYLRVGKYNSYFRMRLNFALISSEDLSPINGILIFCSSNSEQSLFMNKPMPSISILKSEVVSTPQFGERLAPIMPIISKPLSAYSFICETTKDESLLSFSL